MSLQANKLMVRIRGTYAAFATWDQAYRWAREAAQDHGVHLQVGKLPHLTPWPWAAWVVAKR